MCEALEEAKQSAYKNTDVMVKRIASLSIPCRYKGVFMHLVDERGYRFDEETISQMKSIGATNSDVCLMILEGNRKLASLIVAYRLATELKEDSKRAKAVEIIHEQGKKVLSEKSILLAILSVR